MTVAEALLAEAIDYAGLFPPAGLGMEEAVRNYQHYRGEGGAHSQDSFADGWMLGGFVLSAARLREFASVFERVCCGERERPWTLNVVLSQDRAADAQAIEGLAEGAVFIAALEMKIEDEPQLRDLPEPQRLHYLEIAPDKADTLLPAIAQAGARAKLRTGGLTADAVPSPQAVAGFLIACRRHRIAFKATAGLHHAVRGMRKLTYEAGSPQAKMHGFLNLLLAACQAWHDAPAQAILRTLEEEDPSAFRISENAIHWHDERCTAQQAAEVRRDFAMGFGSCSFAEPVDELKAMGWI